MITWNIILNLFLLHLIVVMVVDISGAIDSLKSGLKWLLTKGKMKGNDYRLKPLDCSLCMSFWCGIIYLLIVGEFTLPYVTVVLFMACLSEVTKSAILLVKDIFVTIINLIYKLIDR